MPAHVTLPTIASALAAAAGVFLAAKCAANLGATRSGVHVCDPAIASDRANKFLGLAHVVRENGRSQALRHVVVDCDCFIEVAISHQIKQRPERLVLHNFKIQLGGRQTRLHVAVARKIRPL